MCCCSADCDASSSPASVAVTTGGGADVLPCLRFFSYGTPYALAYASRGEGVGLGAAAGLLVGNTPEWRRGAVAGGAATGCGGDDDLLFFREEMPTARTVQNWTGHLFDDTDLDQVPNDSKLRRCMQAPTRSRPN